MLDLTAIEFVCLIAVAVLYYGNHKLTRRADKLDRWVHLVARGTHKLVIKSESDTTRIIELVELVAPYRQRPPLPKE